MKDPARRKVSAGTKLMLVLTILVLIGTGILLNRLYSDGVPDVSRTRTDAVSRSGNGAGTGDQTGGRSPDLNRGSTVESQSNRTSGQTSSTASPVRKGTGSFTLTVAGTAVMEGDVRKSCYYEDVKVYDFSEVMSLLKTELRSDVNILFLENIISDDGKVTDVIVPSSLTAMLKTAGFNMAACGFSKAWDKEGEGISSTRQHLLGEGIVPLGICDPADQNPVRIQEYGGIRVVFLQYTDTIKSAVRKKMANQQESRTVPAADPEEIRNDIAEARKQGADAVIVLLNWGKTGGKQPDKAQRNLAQSIAEAGADLIIGSGSRYPQTAEYLTANDRQVLCVWSLGTTLSGERKSTDWLSGYLFHAELTLDSTGVLSIGVPAYTPLYTWKSNLTGKLGFRCLAANGAIPDGMDADQQKTMGKAAEVTRKAVQDSPMQER